MEKEYTIQELFEEPEGTIFRCDGLRLVVKDGILDLIGGGFNLTKFWLEAKFTKVYE